MDQFTTFFRTRLFRHLRHPGTWIVIILTMIGARLFIPLPGEGYVTLSINNAYPVMSSGVMGLQLGIISALLLSPLAYIYLRAGASRTQPWQVTDVTPARRFALNLGQGLGDIAALWFILFWIGTAGLILSFFRLPLAEINPLHTMYTLFVVAGPALAMVAGVKTLFDARPWLRGAWGDVLFFILWMTGNVIAASLFQFDNAPHFIDVFGFAASSAVSSPEPVEFLAVGSSPASEKFITLDPIGGFANAEFLTSRLMWVLISVGLFLLAALLYRPRRQKQRKSRRISGVAISGLDKVGQLVMRPILPIFGLLSPVMRSNVSQIMRPRWMFAVLLVVSIAGFFLPFRKIIGPLLMLVLLLMIARFSSIWEARHLRQLRSSFASSLPRQVFMAYLSCALLVLICLLPSIVRSIISGSLPELTPDFAFMILGMPLLLITFGVLTRSAVLGRLVMLGIWYGYLNV